MKVLDVDGLKRVVSNVSDKIAEEADARKNADTSLGNRIGSVETDLTGIKGLTYGTNASKLVDVVDGSYCSPALDEIQKDISDLQSTPSGTEVNSIAPLTVSVTPTVSNEYGVAIGRYAQDGKYPGVAIGNTASTEGNSTAVGYGAMATGGSVALGHASRALGTSGVAIGSSAGASGKNSVAVGCGATASEDNVFSVGNSRINRRIINVTDPTEAQDAATKNYVDTAIAGATVDTATNEDIDAIFTDVLG